jgi:hypothetical protein
MIRHFKLPILVLIVIVVGLLVDGRQAQAITYAGVGVYDESLTVIAPNLISNQIDTNAAAGAGAGTNVSVAQFTTDVLTAFNADAGAVVNFDGAALTTEKTFDVTYGASQANTLTVTLTTLAGGVPAFNFQTGGDASSVPVSGTQYFGLSTGSDYGLTFSTPLVEWGLTALSRTASRTVNAITITLDDASTYVFSNEAIAASTSGVNGPDDTFFGYSAPTGRTISSVAIDASGTMRWDEMGFIVVPEPNAWLLGGIGLVGIAGARKRRSIR